MEERIRVMTPIESESALKRFARVHTIEGNEGYSNSFELLEDATDSMVSVLRRNKPTKVKLIFRCNMQRLLPPEIKPFAFSSNIEVNLEATDEYELYIRMIDLIEERIQNINNTTEGSGWSFHSVIKLELHIVDYQPLRGGSYIDLPQFIKAKQAIINMKN